MYGIFTYMWLIFMVNVGNIPYMDSMGKAIGTFLSWKIGYWRLDMVGCPLPWSFARAYSLPFMPTLWGFVIVSEKVIIGVLVLLTFLEKCFCTCDDWNFAEQKDRNRWFVSFSVQDHHHVSFPSSYCQDISNGGEGGDEAEAKTISDDYLRTD